MEGLKASVGMGWELWGFAYSRLESLLSLKEFFLLIEKTCLLSSFCPRSSVRHKVAEEKDLSSSWQDGIPVKETAASLLVCGGLCAEGFRNTLSLLSRELWG